MDEELDKQWKREIMKDVILQLHQGLSIEETKHKFEKEIGSISPTASF